MRDKILLRQLQMLPLSAKILMTQQRIREWYNYWNGNVYISFSGGKDSTVLTHLVHDMYPDVPLVFANTGLEYPEIQAFARDMGAEFVRPKMSFSEVISTYGYPIISKEVAEAIYFARRIVPKKTGNNYAGGGTNRRTSNGSNSKEREVVLHYERSRLELHGERDDTERIRKRAETREIARQDGLETSKPHWKNSVERTSNGNKAERAGKCNWGGGAREIRRILRARKQLLGK